MMRRITSFRSKPTPTADIPKPALSNEQDFLAVPYKRDAPKEPTPNAEPPKPPLVKEQDVLGVPNKKEVPKGAATKETRFSFERLVTSFQSVTFPRPQKDTEGALPNCPCFLSAIDETILLFDELGAAFGFVSRQIQEKNNILKKYAKDLPNRYVSLENAVTEEMNDGSAYSKPPPSGARTLLRLMWALKFIDCLLAHLDPEKGGTLKEAVAIAYGSALAEHHAWPIRTSVRAAINVLPSKEQFVKRIGATQPLVEKLSAILAPMVSTMYKYYEKRKILDLQ